MMQKPYAESCVQNREPILSVLKPLLKTAGQVLEIGSGTGQHAVYFAAQMPHLRWQTSDCQPYLAGIRLWLEDAALENTLPPLLLDVAQSAWPEARYDAIFSANTLHIMHHDEVAALFEGAGEALTAEGQLLIYGPFNYQGRYTSRSNEQFDQWLKNRDAASGIKDFEEVKRLAEENGLVLQTDYAMPANNRILHFSK